MVTDDDDAYDDDEAICLLPAWGFLLVFYSNRRPKTHSFCDGTEWQTDGRTDGRTNRGIA